MALLHEEKGNIEQENLQMRDRVNQSESLEDPSSPASIRHSQMMNQIEALQEETYRWVGTEKAWRSNLIMTCTTGGPSMLISMINNLELSWWLKRRLQTRT